jgi:hypothetical protein
MRNEKDHHLSACKDDLQLIHQASSMLKPYLKTSHIPFAITETESHTHREGCHLKTCKTPFATTERREREREVFKLFLFIADVIQVPPAATSWSACHN